MSLYIGYKGADHCVNNSYDAPGTRALAAWFLGVYQSLGGRNGGIFNCRNIAGTNTLSLHAEARALDAMTEAYPSRWGWKLANFWRDWSAELGIQAIIYDRKVWSGAKPYAGWRDLLSGNMHTDHLHVEVNEDAAQTLTVVRINSVARMAHTMRMLPVLRRTDTSDSVQAVKNCQALLNAHAGTMIAEDGVFGRATDARVRQFQTAHNLTVDGVVGINTWTALLDVQ